MTIEVNNSKYAVIRCTPRLFGKSNVRFRGLALVGPRRIARVELDCQLTVALTDLFRDGVKRRMPLRVPSKSDPGILGDDLRFGA